MLLSLIALIVALLAIYFTRVFSRLLDAEHLDSFESFVRLLIKKSDETIQDLSKECASVASQLDEPKIRNIEMTQVILRTRYFQEVTMPKLFEIMVVSRTSRGRNAQNESFFKLSDAIEKVTGIQDAALRDFFDFDRKYDAIQNDLFDVTRAMSQLADQIQSPLISEEDQRVGGNAIVNVIPDTFEAGFVFTFKAWIDASDVPGVASKKLVDAYYLSEHLYIPMRKVALRYKKHPFSPYLISLVTSFEYYFDNLKNLKNRYATAFKENAERLLTHKETIEREASFLLSKPRTDFDYKVRIVRKPS